LAPLNRGASTAPTFMALTCRWRSRPQHRKRTCALQLGMSAKGQKRTHAVQQTVELFDHFVGAVEEDAGNIEL
jgi:hypothetical protein